MSDWPNFQLENFATHSPWGCLPVFCANEWWMHQKNNGKCLGSMDRLRGITVSWRSGSSNLSTWRVYLLLKILTRFDLFCFICICQKSPFFPALYKTHECSYVLKPHPSYCWRSSTWAGWALAAHGQLSVVHIKMLHCSWTLVLLKCCFFITLIWRWSCCCCSHFLFIDACWVSAGGRERWLRHSKIGKACGLHTHWDEELLNML